MITFNTFSGIAVQGVPYPISGTLSPGTDMVQIGISDSATTAPTEFTQIGAPRGNWSISLIPSFTGDAFVWAQQVTPLLPEVSLSISRDRGYSFGDARMQTLGALGKRKTIVQFWRLGMGRDVVFKLRWSSPSRTALQGAFIEVEPSAT
jgi:hypothetical protein